MLKLIGNDTANDLAVEQALPDLVMNSRDTLTTAAIIPIETSEVFEHGARRLAPRVTTTASE
jgi:hypothetical protein